MAEKGGASGSAPPHNQMPDAPPSYEASMATGGAPKGATAGTAGGFKMPEARTAAPNYHSPPPQQQQPPVIVQYVQTPNFGPHPVNMTCPHCQSQIRTSTDSEPGPMAWVLAGILCVVGLWPCACIPCCIESLNSVSHKCPNCKNFLGRYKGGM